VSVFAFKCSAAGAFVQVYTKPNGRTDSRLGITVTKKFVSHATARNYCKRLVREVFRAERAALGGMDLVVRVRGPVSSASSVRARTEIIDLMHRVRRLCNDRANALPAS
jgi:ribonuclease P protein component